MNSRTTTRTSTRTREAGGLNKSGWSGVVIPVMFFRMHPRFQISVWLSLLALLAGGMAHGADLTANRFTYLDESDPFYVHRDFPKLITPQWVGEEGVEAVVTLGVDDMREPEKYEAFLRPILERLKQIDGRAPVSILTVNVNPQHPLLAGWLKEGLSIEVHTLTHPCPLLQKGNFDAAANVVHGCNDLLSQIAGNVPVAYRMPCCDSMNTPSPRFYAEIFNRTSADGKYLQIDTSVMNFPTPKDASLPKELVELPDGSSRFYRYKVQQPVAQGQKSLKSFATTIEDYPYPYVIGKLCWEFPPTVPSDWEAANLRGPNQAETLADMKAALDIAVRKQGTYNLVFHPHGWIQNAQIVELIDYANRTYGKKVKFLTFKECLERLNKNLLMDQPLRAKNGQDNGVRLLDLNGDGYQDVILSNDDICTSRIWDNDKRAWLNTGFFTELVKKDRKGNHPDAGVRFGVVGKPGKVFAFLRTEKESGAYVFENNVWMNHERYFSGLQVEGEAVFSMVKGVDRGVRFRDVDKDGSCELIVGNPTQNAVFSWDEGKQTWERRDFNLPADTSIVDAQGKDNGLRFVDINEDGFDDVIFSNAERYSLHLYVTNPVPRLGWFSGWSYESRAGKRGDAGEIPMIVRAGEYRNNGVWFHSGHMWIQNEDTAQLPDVVDRRSYQQLLAWETPQPKSPQEALKTFQLMPGFKIELVAYEPMVTDPVAIEWGEDGKLWVVEMNDYPLGMDGKGAPGGKIKYLEDLDGDGKYEKATTFMDKLSIPCGVIPWRKGIIACAGPEIFYAEDTDGDGKADVRKTLYTGFAEGNQQHRVNGFQFGLDNWIYGANGDSGGVVSSIATSKAVDINRRDFRFRPDTGEFETQAGRTQYGRYRDDWGNWFGNNNPTWLWHYYIPEQYLGRNPLVNVRDTRKYLANYPDPTRVFPISAPMTRLNQPQSMNYVTSGNSASPYRDDLFGSDFATSVFVSEPVHNVVHREVLVADGVSFQSHRASGEEKREFVASTDHWFRPDMTKTGPDGALYICDFYRFVLEHPQWISPEAQKALDIRGGSDMGRIYRVYPENAKLRPTPRLDRMNTAQLVAAIDSPNGWQRDTAQRLLYQQQDKAAVEPLKKMLAENASAKVRLQALATLDGLGVVDMATLKLAWHDQHEAVRELGVRLAEEQGKAISDALRSPDGVSDFAALVEDPAIRVRYQMAFTLGVIDEGGPLLTRLMLRDFSDEAMRVAIMCSLPKHAETVAERLYKVPGADNVTAALRAVLATAAATAAADDLQRMLLSCRLNVHDDGQLVTVMAGVMEGLKQRKLSWEQFKQAAKDPVQLGHLDIAFALARKMAATRELNENLRVTAMELCGLDAKFADEEGKMLAGLLVPQEPQAIQKAALQALRRVKGADGATALVAAWGSLSSGLRGMAFEAFVGRRDWLGTLLDGVQSGKIPVAQITPAQRQQLLSFPAMEVKNRAEQLFKPANRDRQSLVNKYMEADALVGRREKGRALFEQNCTACHRLAGLGQEIGPDLGMVGTKPTEVLVTAILDPNQAMEERYTAYQAETTEGEEVSGVIATETPTAITIKTAAGTEVVISRSHLKKLRSSGLSLMPEGLEAVLDVQGMADLLAFLRKPQ